MDRFIPHSDFFTIDVADRIGKTRAPRRPPPVCLKRHGEVLEPIGIEGIDRPFQTSRTELENIANKYLLAVLEAGRIYRHIAEKQGRRRIS